MVLFSLWWFPSRFPPTCANRYGVVLWVAGLPIEVRDSFVAKHTQELARVESNVGREYQAMQLHARGDTGTMTNATLHEGLLRMARKTPYYERNLPHICSFFARGECTRGDECPYRHEMPRSRDDPLSHQNIKDRFEVSLRPWGVLCWRCGFVNPILFLFCFEGCGIPASFLPRSCLGFCLFGRLDVC